MLGGGPADYRYTIIPLILINLWYYGNINKTLIPLYHIETMAEKHKTSINIDPEIWNEWLHFVLDETGSTRKVSDELEKAIKLYMKNRKTK